ncbi:MAG: metallophosphoesterase [Candidatus Odinarchaeum yellowstonii]|uniref:Phosphoesterase n=1 Tax=Odinarchaeota yellowstonii (strain LCB_4) TaxID=1841599 RepID=A0AAF0IBV2_ODILC|nr:MAG: metallophosphoesterase [Candidatus Odinarchaeum yellowstonii]
MKIGVISDTHDNLSAVKEAVKIFNEHEVSKILHAGDIISPFVIKEFKASLSPVTFVYGNNDGEILHLKKIIGENGFELAGRFYQDVLAGKRVAMIHGDTPIIQALIKSRMYDIIVSGHTHKRVEEKDGGVLHVNPGEACGYLTGERSICIVDLEKLSVKPIVF